MLGTTMPASKRPSRPTAIAIPEDVRRRLMPWIDARAVGAEGFWEWLATVLPALPPPSGATPLSAQGATPEERVRDLARDLVHCAGERAMLNMTCAQYFRDNQSMAVRLKALEAALRTARRAGTPVELEDSPESTTAAERYLPARKDR